MKRRGVVVERFYEISPRGEFFLRAGQNCIAGAAARVEILRHSLTNADQSTQICPIIDYSTGNVAGTRAFSQTEMSIHFYIKYCIQKSEKF